MPEGPPLPLSLLRQLHLQRQQLFPRNLNPHPRQLFLHQPMAFGKNNGRETACALSHTAMLRHSTPSLPPIAPQLILQRAWPSGGHQRRLQPIGLRQHILRRESAHPAVTTPTSPTPAATTSHAHHAPQIPDGPSPLESRERANCPKDTPVSSTFGPGSRQRLCNAARGPANLLAIRAIGVAVLAGRGCACRALGSSRSQLQSGRSNPAFLLCPSSATTCQIFCSSEPNGNGIHHQCGP